MVCFTWVTGTSRPVDAETPNSDVCRRGGVCGSDPTLPGLTLPTKWVGHFSSSHSYQWSVYEGSLVTVLRGVRTAPDSPPLRFWVVVPTHFLPLPPTPSTPPTAPTPTSPPLPPTLPSPPLLIAPPTSPPLPPTYPPHLSLPHPPASSPPLSPPPLHPIPPCSTHTYLLYTPCRPTPRHCVVRGGKGSRSGRGSGGSGGSSGVGGVVACGSGHLGRSVEGHGSRGRRRDDGRSVRPEKDKELPGSEIGSGPETGPPRETDLPEVRGQGTCDGSRTVSVRHRVQKPDSSGTRSHKVVQQWWHVSG